MTVKGVESLKYAEQLLREGKKQEAQLVLVEFIQGTPSSAHGWWLLSFALTDLMRQIECVERVLQIAPHYSPAHDRLNKLKGSISIARPVPPFIEETITPPQSIKQDSQPAIKQDPAPKKQNSRFLQYATLAVMACMAVGILGFVAVTLVQTGIPMQSVLPTAFTQISLPPTWTPQPTATQRATITPYPTITPVILPTLEISPTSPVPKSQIGPYNGYYAPNFSLNNINDNVQTSLSDYEGQAVIIFFWATWCQYCRAEMPNVEMIFDNYRDQGLVVLAVDVGESAKLARTYRDEQFLTFPILDDASRKVSSKYQVTAFPTFFFVNPSGVITSVNIGGVGYWRLDSQVKTMLNLP